MTELITFEELLKRQPINVIQVVVVGNQYMYEVEVV